MPNDNRLSEAKQKLLELRRRGVNSSAADAPARKPGEPIPLSSGQEQVWRLEQTAGKLTPFYNESITLHRHGPCDPGAVERAFTEIVRRHEVWRTTFEVRNGEPVQIVHPAPAKFPLSVIDLRTHSPVQRTGAPSAATRDSSETMALELATQDARQPFDLSRGPLLRARLVTLSDDEHRLYLTAHQIVVDGVTVYDVFPSELTALYESFASGSPSPLPELPVQFADFATAQRGRMNASATEMQLAYWKKQLAGDLRPVAWPNDPVRPSAPTYRGAIHPFLLSAQLTESLRAFGKREGVTLFMVLLAALAALVHRYTSRDDIVIGTLSPSGRKQPEFQRLLGYFLNPVPLRTNLSGNPTFRELLRQAREVTLGAISHDDLPLQALAKAIRLAPDLTHNPLFTVVLSVAPDVAPLPPCWGMTFMDVESGGSRWDFYLELSDRSDGMMGRAQYNPDVFSLATVQQTLHDLQIVLNRAIEDPSATIANITPV